MANPDLVVGNDDGGGFTHDHALVFAKSDNVAAVVLREPNFSHSVYGLETNSKWWEFTEPNTHGMCSVSMSDDIEAFTTTDGVSVYWGLVVSLMRRCSMMRVLKTVKYAHHSGGVFLRMGPGGRSYFDASSVSTSALAAV